MLLDASHVLTQTKHTGADGLRGHVMKVCADHLGPFFTRFFQLLLNTHSMPRSWKQSTIMPIAKKPASDNLMTFGQWRLHVSLLNVWKDLYVIN